LLAFSTNISCPRPRTICRNGSLSILWPATAVWTLGMNGCCFMIGVISVDAEARRGSGDGARMEVSLWDDWANPETHDALWAWVYSIGAGNMGLYALFGLIPINMAM